MDNNNPQSNNPVNMLDSNLGPQKNLPNAVAVLVLGICSIPMCFCYGFPGLVCAIVSLVLAKKDSTTYASNPGAYTLSSFNNLKAGRVCAIVGLSLSALVVLYVIFWIVVAGTVAATVPWTMTK